MKLVYSPWGNGLSTKPFDEIFSESVNGKECGFAGADAFLLWGGTDIHPSFYGAAAHRLNQAPTLPSERDMWEWKAMRYCKIHGIPIIGVCRGAQFLCAFAGGVLAQHIHGHHTDHHVHTIDGEIYSVTSSHHQMMVPFSVPHTMVAWSAKNQSSFYYGETSETSVTVERALKDGTFKEPETVFFPEIRGLAIQGHPEWAEVNSRFVQDTLRHIQHYLFGKDDV